MKKLKPSTKWIIAIGLFLVVVIGYLIVLFTPNWYQNSAAYPLWFIKCGWRQPVLGMSDIKWYYLPQDKGYGTNIFVDKYFCSEAEAQVAGFERALQ